MRKRILMLLAVLALALTAAAALSACGNGQEPADLSGDVSFSLQSVCGEDLENGAVTLTTAQYEALKSAEDKTAQCEYELAAKASVSATLNDKTLTFAVTAEDGTKEEYTFTLTVLSNDVSLTVTKISEAKAENGAVTLTTAQYEALKSAEDKAAQCEYELAAKASVSATLNDKTLTFAVTAEDGTKKEYTFVLTVLSNDVSLTVTKISGAKAENGAVTLTTAQYEALKNAEDKAALCEFELAAKAGAAVTLSDKTLIFAVTAEDGTKKEYAFALTVLSDDVSFVLDDICGAAVIGDGVTLTEEQFRTVQSGDILENSTYTAAARSEVSAQYRKEDHTVVFTVLSEDKSAEAEYTFGIGVANLFGTHSVSGYGSGKNGAWSFEKDGYLLTGNAAILNESGKNIEDYYAFFCDVSVQDLAEDSEFLLISNQADNLMTRFALRGEDGSHVKVFSDYRNMSGFKNYLEHLTGIEHSAGDFVRMGVINCGNSTAMFLNGKLVYRRTLDTISHSELCVSAYACGAVLKNIEITEGREEVEAMFAEALAGYTDKIVGLSETGSSENFSKFIDNGDGCVSVQGSTSNARVMGALLHEGVPVAGNQYAVEGKVRVSNTKTSGGSASKVEFQIFQDFSNFIKFHLFRFPTNNSFYSYPTVNGKMSTIVCEDKTMPTGTDYTLDFLFVYDNGTIEVWLKDGSYMPEYKCVYTLETGWGYTSYLIAMRQYCDVLFSDFEVYKGVRFDSLYALLHASEPSETFALSESAEEYGESPAFTAEESNAFYKTSEEYAKAFLFREGELLAGDYWIVGGTMSFLSYRTWGQCEIQIYIDETHAIRYVFEYVSGGNFQVFTEIKRGESQWQQYKIVQRPQSSLPSRLNFAIVNCNNEYSFLIDGYVYHSWKDANLTGASITFGGQKCTMKLSGLYAETDRAAVEEFSSSMQEYEYVSPYENRIASLAEEYAGAEKGGVLLAGSSTIDFWDTWQEDIGTDTLGYNVGIGGTIVEDWLYAYDRLIAPFNPSKIVLFLGGNNVNNQGDTGEYTAQLLAELLEKMHADFPEAEIYYVLSLPVPNNYSNGKYTVEYGRLIECMKQYGAENEWLTVIDMESSLVKDGNPIPEYFRSDGVHLTEAGYAVWSEYINRIVLPKES